MFKAYYNFPIERSRRRDVFCKKGALENFARGLQLYWKRDSGIGFMFYEIFKNTFFYRTRPVAASEYTAIAGLKSF